MLLAPQKSKSNDKMKNQTGDVIVVAGWERLSNGRLGPVQKSGAILLGDCLVQVNRIQIVTLKFQDVMSMLRSLRENGTLRSLTFISSKNHRNSGEGGVRGGSTTEERSVYSKSKIGQSGLRRKYSFSSSVTSSRINLGKKQGNTRSESASNDGGEQIKSNDPVRPFAEYKIECRLLMRGFGGELTETTQSWTIWKRFSQFQELYDKLVHTYGWQLTNVEENSQTPFPSKKPLSSSLLFLNGRLMENFMESRRDELDQFWQSMLKIEEITDFAQPHRYSRDLASFLSIEEYLYPPATGTIASRSSSHLANAAASSRFNASSTLATNEGQENVISDDSSSGTTEDGSRLRQVGSILSHSFPSVIQDKARQQQRINTNNSIKASLVSSNSFARTKDQPSINTAVSPTFHKNLIPAKSSFQRHNPSIVGNSCLVFRNVLFAK